MRKIVDYRIVFTGDDGKHIREKLAAGWQPWGSPFPTTYSSWQAMVKYEETHSQDTGPK